ncbi:MAG TPA: helix-turn-helix domain-containing protein [Mucilaginibacter sp.]
MKFEVHLPCNQLLPYVKHLIISENENSATYKVLPDTALVIGFQYRGKLSYTDDGQETLLSTAGITGLRDSYRVFNNTAGVGSVLVVFRENGATRFIRTPLHELFNESLSLGHFFDRSTLSEIEERLALAADDRARIKLIEGFLIDQLSDRQPDILVTHALEYIHASKGTIRIAELARKLNTSASPLEKRFRQEVGASPKKFSMIVRAQNVLAAMDNGQQNYAEYLLSYYDQAHFIKDFKKFVSLTPEEYLKNLR